MTLEFLQSELRLSLKDVETLRRWQLHYLRLAEALMACAMSVDDPLAAADWELGADLCAAQAEKLGRMVAQRQSLEGRFVHEHLVGARHRFRARMERLEREEREAA